MASRSERPTVELEGRIETVESAAVKHETTYYESAERKPLPEDFGESMFNIPTHAMDTFSLSDRTRAELGITEDFGYTYVLDPDSQAARQTGVNRERQIKDTYPGSEVVYDPETHQKVRCTDTVLMKIPLKYFKDREANLKAQTDLATLSNPVLHRELGISREQSAAYRKSFNPELAEIQAFDPRDKEQILALIERSDAQSRPMRNSNASPTYNMTFADAVESKIKQIARANNLDTRTPNGRKKAEEIYETEYLPALQRRAMANGRVSHRPSWSESLRAARSMHGQVVSMNVGFGKSAMEILSERKSGQRDQGRSTTRQRP